MKMVFVHFNGDSLLIPKLAMKLGGIWPPDRTKRRSLIIFVIFSVSRIAAMITVVIDFHQNIRPKDEMFAGCVYPLIGFLGNLLFRLNSGQLVRLIEWKINGWSTVTNPQERQIMKRHKIFGAFFFFVSILNTFIAPMVRLIMFFPFYTNHELSFQQKTAVTDNYTRIAVTTMLYWITMYGGFLVKYGTLMLFWSLNTHLSEQFKILKKHFQQFLRIKNKNTSRRRFRSLIDRHNQLLNFSDDLENSFSFVLALIVTVNQLIICFHAYYLAVAKLNGSLIEIAREIEVISFNLLLILLVYYSGECLTTCSAEIGDVFRECKWHNLSKDSRINFSIVILQSGRPKKLTIAGLYKLNLSNYTYMVQTVYSYISLILAITKNEV